MTDNNKTMDTDKQLLAKAKKLDPAALRSIHHQFYQPVARYIQFKVGNTQTVEDLSGEVFVRVLENLKRGRGWHQSPKSWIMGITRNVVADYYRKRERLTEVILDEGVAASDEADPTMQALLNEEHEHLRQAINRLTGEQRDVILLRFVEGIDIKGVAEAMDKTPGAIKGLQFRALRALAEIMDTSSKRTVGAQ